MSDRRSITRRCFLKGAAGAGLGYWVAGGVKAQQSRSPSSRIAMACIGVGGKGARHITPRTAAKTTFVRLLPWGFGARDPGNNR
jgi:hypothetical protein